MGHWLRPVTCGASEVQQCKDELALISREPACIGDFKKIKSGSNNLGFDTLCSIKLVGYRECSGRGVVQQQLNGYAWWGAEGGKGVWVSGGGGGGRNNYQTGFCRL